MSPQHPHSANTLPIYACRMQPWWACVVLANFQAHLEADKAHKCGLGIHCPLLLKPCQLLRCCPSVLTCIPAICKPTPDSGLFVLAVLNNELHYMGQYHPLLLPSVGAEWPSYDPQDHTCNGDHWQAKARQNRQGVRKAPRWKTLVFTTNMCAIWVGQSICSW